MRHGGSLRDNIGFGDGMKISLRFSNQFWNSNMTRLLMDGPLASCWSSNEYQTGNSDHVLTCFLMGKNSETMEALLSGYSPVKGDACAGSVCEAGL